MLVSILFSFRQKHELCSKDGDETSSVMFDEDTTDLIDKVKQLTWNSRTLLVFSQTVARGIH